MTVLLGAGASKSAGVPISTEMTHALLQQINFRSRAILHFVYGGLLMEEAARAYSRGSWGSAIAVDAEDLFNGVEALANRSDLDAAPFIASWHPLIDQFDGYEEGGLEREINNGLGRLGSPHGAGHLARTLANAINRGKKGNHFEQVASDMISKLKELLAVTEASQIEYLAPLIELHKEQDGGLLIATLNYDTLLEQVGAAHATPVDDCLDHWLASGLIKRTNSLTLLKLHGSINWVQGRDGSINRAGNGGSLQPALIFGGANKLRADGPYLEMLWEWRSHLDKCDHIVIVGYSFRDTHVNALIERWHKQDSSKRITIVDPGFSYQTNRLTRYLHYLSNEDLAPFETIGNQRRQTTHRLEAPVQLIKAGAEQVLPSLFSEISTWPKTSTERPRFM